MESRNQKKSIQKPLRKNKTTNALLSYMKNIQKASFIYWCHKNKRLDLLDTHNF